MDLEDKIRKIKAKALVIDDDSIIRDILGQLLEKQGYSVAAVSDGEEGLLSFYERNPDLVITDLNMPMIDGYEVIKEIREKSRRLPVLFTTGDVSDEAIEKAYEIGATDYIKKPINTKITNQKLRIFSEMIIANYINRQQSRKLKNQFEIASEQARTNAQLAETLFKQSSDIVFGLDDTLHFTVVNPAFCSILGYTENQARLMELPQIFHPDTMKTVNTLLMKEKGLGNVNDRTKQQQGEYQKFITRSGKTLYVKGKIATQNKNGKSISYIGQYADHTDIWEERYKTNSMARELKKMAFYDQLTGLPNRESFNIALEKIIGQASRHDIEQKGALLFIDLDNFKKVNDTYGHQLGDQLLIEAGRRLKGTLRTSDLISRWAGDEFVSILRPIRDYSDAGKIAEKINASISEPYFFNGNTIDYISASIGISVFPKDGNDPRTITSKADTALFHVKDCGKGKHAFYSSEMGNKSEKSIANPKTNLFE